MKKVILLSTMTTLLISCSSSEETKSLAPDFGYHVDRIVNVLEKQIVIGTFTAVVPDGGEVTYSSSNSDITFRIAFSSFKAGIIATILTASSTIIKISRS